MKVLFTCFVILIVMFSNWVNDAAAQVPPVSDRTPQVRDAIVAAAGVPANEVTEAHLAAITSLGLGDKNITSLKAGDFDGLNNLIGLYLYGNKLSTLPSNIFDNLTQLTTLWLGNNQLSTLPPNIFNNLTQLTWLELDRNQLSTLPPNIFDNLTQLTTLWLWDNQLSTLPSGIFDNLTQLTTLLLWDNQLSTLPPGIFAGLTELTTLRLHGNAVDPLPLPVSLEAVGNSAFKAIVSTGAPFDIVLPLVVSNGSLTTGATTVTIAKGQVESAVLTVNRTPGTSGAVTVNIGGLPGIPTDVNIWSQPNHQGYALVKSGTLPLEVISGIIEPPPPIDDPPPPTNNPPVFTEGASTTRTIAENTAAGTNIGSAVSAIDADDDTLTYTLSGTDAAAFSIVSTTGQLQTKVALDYETKTSYSVTVTASDGNGGSDSITVTINVTDVNELPPNRAPAFTEGASATRSIAENTPANRNIGSPVSATDADNDTLTYSLGGTNASSFGIVSSSGQLRTKAALDYETKNSYTVTVTVRDTAGASDSITVTINITDVNELPPNRAPTFTEGASTTRTVAENTAAGTNIGSAVSATDADGDTLTYTLSGTDAAAFSIVSTTGQLRTQAALDYETKSIYTVAITASDGTLTDIITVTINVTDIDEGPSNRAPVFTEGASTTRTIAENTAAGTNIGSAVSATDADGDTLTYTLSGPDAAAFSIVSTTGQLRTQAALNTAIKSVYFVTVAVSDGKTVAVSGGVHTVTISVIINVTDAEMPPVLDVNSDDVVDIVDLLLVAASFGTTIDPTTPNPADVNGDGVVGLTDLLLVIGGMGFTGGVAAAPVLSEANLHHWIAEAKRQVLGDATFEKGIAVLEQLLDAVRPTPKETLLLSNYPNPFNPETWIPYQLAKDAEVTVTISDVRGVVVRQLVLGHKPAGVYHSRARAAHWNGRNAFGEKVASGVYFYIFTARDFTATRKMLIRK